MMIILKMRNCEKSLQKSNDENKILSKNILLNGRPLLYTINFNPKKLKLKFRFFLSDDYLISFKLPFHSFLQNNKNYNGIITNQFTSLWSTFLEGVVKDKEKLYYFLEKDIINFYMKIFYFIILEVNIKRQRNFQIHFLNLNF